MRWWYQAARPPSSPFHAASSSSDSRRRRNAKRHSCGLHMSNLLDFWGLLRQNRHHFLPHHCLHLLSFWAQDVMLHRPALQLATATTCRVEPEIRKGGCTYCVHSSSGTSLICFPFSSGLVTAERTSIRAPPLVDFITAVMNPSMTAALTAFVFASRPRSDFTIPESVSTVGLGRYFRHDFTWTDGVDNDLWAVSRQKYVKGISETGMARPTSHPCPLPILQVH